MRGSVGTSDTLRRTLRPEDFRHESLHPCGDRNREYPLRDTAGAARRCMPSAFDVRSLVLGASDDMDGAEVMAQLGVPPGPIVGRALEHLLELRLDLGPMTHEDAAEALACWWADQPESAIVVADREK